MVIDKLYDLPVQKRHVTELMVSVTKNVTDRTPQDRNLIEVLKDTIFNNEIHNVLCSKIANENDKNIRTQLKKNLICIIVGVILKGGTSLKNAIMRNPLLAFDFDTDDFVKAVLIKEYCIKAFGKNAVYIGYSVSMRGVHMIIYIGEGRKSDYWLQISNICAKNNFIVDSATKDETRKLYIGNDKDAYINEDPEAFILTRVTEIITQSNGIIVNLDSEKSIALILKQASEKGLSFTDSHRNEFIYFVASQCVGKGIPYSEAVANLNTSINLSSYPDHSHRLQQVYSEQAENFGKYNATTKKNHVAVVREALRSYYDYRFNVIKNRVEFRQIKNDTWLTLTQREFNSIVIFLNADAGITCSVEMVERILNSKEAREIDPFKEYFEALPKWDGIDHMDLLASTVKTTDDNYFRIVLIKWLVGVVATAIDPSVANHIVLVFSGGQGIGKSTWLDKLCPRALGKYIYSGSIDPGNKDSLILISECLLINLSEMDDLTRSERNDLKSIITQMAIITRLPYEKLNEERIRRASFMGSVNTSQFLTDMTGNRRFLCFEIERIDYLTPVDMDKVYAQAYNLYKEGFVFYFTPEEVEQLNLRNETFMANSIEEEYLLESCYPGTKENAHEYWSSTKIAEYIFREAAIKIDSGAIGRLGKVLAKHKFPRITKENRKVYCVNLRIRDDQQSANTPQNDADDWFGLESTESKQ